MGEGVRGIRLLAWAVCAALVPVSVAWAQAPGRTAEQDDVFWESVSGCTSAVEVEMYISEFGEEGRHVAEARACLEKLGKAVPASGRKTAATEVERLLKVCEMHFAANRLTTGVGGTAIECYQEVQSLDPANREAVEGLQRVFGKYAAWARAALEKGDAGKARGHVEKLKGLAPEAPEIAELESGVTRLEKQAAEAREKAERGARGAGSTPTTTSAANCGKVTIAEMAWASAAVAAHIEDIILSAGYGCQTEIVFGDTVPTVTSMTEKSEPDVAPEIWINSAREVIEKAVEEGRLVVAGEILSDGGEEGWWVPDYVIADNPDLTTLQAVLKRPDLFPDKEEPGMGRFYTCPSGWGCEIVNGNLYKAYGVKEAGFTLFNPGSSEGLAAAITGAYERRQPIFAYYWAPTSLLGNHPMVKLGGMTHDSETWPCITDKDCAEPKPNMYPKSVVMTVVTSSFAKSAPEAFEFVSRVSWGNKFLNGLLAWQDQNQATARETAEHFLKNNEDVWSAWVPEDVAAKVKAAL